jgi:hypothetical protein
MPQPLASSVHANKLMTNVAYRTINTSYVANLIWPIVPVNNESDKYAHWPASQFLRNEAQYPKAPGTPAAQIGIVPDLTRTYNCEEYALACVLPSRIKANADSVLQLQARATERVMDAIRLGLEIRVATACGTAANWTSTNVALATTTLWSAASTSDPVANIDAIIGSVEDACLERVNYAVTDVKTWRVLRRHPSITALCFGPGGDRNMIVTPQLFAAAFELDEFYVGRAIYTTSAEGTAEASITRVKIWSNNPQASTQTGQFFVGHKPAGGPSILEQSAGYIMRAGLRVRSWFSEAPDADIIEASEIVDEVVVSPNAGGVIVPTVAA